MAPQKFILYDLPSRDPNAAWSYNPWKIRLALNFKKIEYETKWLEYPDIEPYLKNELGLPPNPPDGFAPYTIPTATFPDGQAIMDSKDIIARLEKDYPTPSLHLDSPLVPTVAAALGKVAGPLFPDILARVPRDVLNPSSAEYFQRTRKERFGLTLDDLKVEKGGDKAWGDAKEPLAELAALFKDTTGPYILGDTPSYADFHTVTFIHFLKRVGGGLYERFIAHDKVFEDLYNAYAPYFERDSY